MTDEWTTDSTVDWKPELVKGGTILWRWNHKRERLTRSRIITIAGNALYLDDGGEYPYWVDIQDIHVTHWQQP